jgi:O-antigen ligase
VKQLIFMGAAVLFGLIGGFIEPFYALVPYYVFSVLQPQYLWAWALGPDARWSLAAAGIALLAILVHGSRVLRNVRWNAVAALLGLYALLLALSCLTAYDAAIAGQWFGVTIKVLLMAALTMVLTDSLTKLRVMVMVVACSLGYLAWHFNSLYLFEGRVDIQRGLGAYDNNGLGGLLVMGLPFAYALGKNARHWAIKLAWALAGVFMVHGILLTYSRGAMVAAILGGAWILWHHRPRLQGAVIAVLIVAVTGVMAGKEVRERFMTIFDDHPDDSVQSRFESWNAAWLMIHDHPVLGVGVRNSNLYTESYGADRRGRTIHNTYLQIAADSGLPALVVYLALQAAAVASLMRGRRRLERWEREHAWRHALMPRHGPRAAPADSREPLAARHDRLRLSRDIILAIQAGLLIFYIHSFFFSSEMFELQWLLIAFAGATPRIVDEFLARLDEEAGEAAQAVESPPAKPRPMAVVRRPLGGEPGLQV